MKYFAYGSNMNPDRMRTRNIRFSSYVSAVLNGYYIAFNKIAKFGLPGEGKTNINKNENGVVQGVLYDIADKDINILDRYEGYPDHYSKINVNVRLQNGEIIEALTYIAHPSKIRQNLRPSREYLNHLLAAKEFLTESYFNNLAASDTVD